MGNSNCQMSVHEKEKETELCMSNGHTVPDVQSLAETSDQPDFSLHGIDYLPESEKRKERRRRRKSTVPRFLRIDTTLWSNSYLRFLNRISRSALTPGTERRDSETYQANNVTAGNGRYVERPENRTEALPIQPVAVETPDCFREIVSDEWTKYSSYPFENLVFSGGGSKGYAYIGTLQALEDARILNRVKRIAGSSAGAICAGLLAVKCTPQEIANVFKCNIKWLFHDQPCACCCLPRVCNKYGVHPARRFYHVYGQHLARKTDGNANITFKEVLEKFGRELCIVVTNLNRMCSEYCSPSLSPDLPIRDAVRMSMSFPVLYRAVRQTLSGRECLYADGGILDQYPISSFDGCQYEVNHNTSGADSSTDKPNDKTLGLYLVSEKALDYKIWQTLFGREIPYKPTYLPNTKLARARLHRELSNRKRENKQFSKREYMEELRANSVMWDHYEVINKSHVDISNVGEYFTTAIETLLISQRRMHVKPNDVKRTVAINCGYIGTNDYEIEPGDREFMIRQGYECTRRFLTEFISSESVGIRPLSCHGDCCTVAANEDIEPSAVPCSRDETVHDISVPESSELLSNFVSGPAFIQCMSASEDSVPWCTASEHLDVSCGLDSSCSVASLLETQV